MSEDQKEKTLRPCRYHTAYPGSMHEKKDGQYIDVDDNESLTIQLLANIREMQHALEDYQDAAARASQWRDIETAPKDGTVILVGFTIIGNLDASVRRVFEARWNDLEDQFTSVNGHWIFGRAMYWQPLPQPPVSK